MDWTNYHHLLYFYTAVKEGGVSKAALALHVSQPTVSKLISMLEMEIGEALWQKSGRGHKLTETGETVYQYAEEIFSLGKEMREALKGGINLKGRVFTIGLNQALPKLLAARIIAPLMESYESLMIKCIEGHLDDLLGDLHDHNIDMILSDAPTVSNVKSTGYNHLLLESAIGIYAVPGIVRLLKQKFPDSLTDAPFLLPTYPSALRTAFNDWCLTHNITPNIIAECDDSGLMKALGAEGLGAFIAPIRVHREITTQYKVNQIGVLPEIKERIWLISPARKIIHPVLKYILKSYSTTTR